MRDVEFGVVLTRPIRQNTLFIPLGISLVGSLSSAAVNPTTSLPEYAKAAIIRTLQKPLKPLCAAPGKYQASVPSASPLNPSPTSRKTPNMLFCQSETWD